MRAPAAILLAGCISSTAIASEATKSLTQCYVAEARRLGSATCGDPQSLVQAVYGKCRQHEDAVAKDFAAEHGQDYYDKTITFLRRKSSPVIYSQIVNSQIAKGCN